MRIINESNREWAERKWLLDETNYKYNTNTSPTNSEPREPFVTMRPLTTVHRAGESTQWYNRETIHADSKQAEQLKSGIAPIRRTSERRQQQQLGLLP